MTRSQPSRKDTKRRHPRGVEVIGRGILREVQQPAQQKESKADRFRRIAPKRLGTIINMVGELKKCADPEGYEYTEAEWKMLLREYVAAGYDLYEAFSSRYRRTKRNVLDEPDLDILAAKITNIDPLDDLKDVL